MKTYRINEIFYSIQGEGVRAGTPAVFIRFSGCNQTCRQETHGFDCDTEFVSGRDMTAEEIAKEAVSLLSNTKLPSFMGGFVDSAFILTGGEPMLQVDEELIRIIRPSCTSLAIETNGSIEIPDAMQFAPSGFGWVTVSPKVAEHAIRQRRANEVRYVRAYGQEIPKTVVEADHYVICPASAGDEVDPKALAWCVELVKQNPKWRLCPQMHKFWRVR